MKRKVKTRIQRANNTDHIQKERNSYLLINGIFAGIIILMFIYSGFFSPDKNNYPVKCIHEQLTGKECPSCGLSRSFSFIIRGDLKSAAEFNEYGLRIFIFFVFQLVMRFSNIVFLMRRPAKMSNLILFDCTLAIATFLLAFGPFFGFYYSLLF